MNFKYHIILYLVTLTVISFLSNFALAMSIDIGIPEKYSKINAGEKVYFETEVKWPENNSRKDLRIEYSVQDKNGVEVAYLKVLKAIETQASFMDSISIPENTVSGMYKINAKFNDYEDLNQEVVASFHVVNSSENLEKKLFMIIGVLGVVVLLVVIEMFILMRKNHYK